jgi:hypothetical protein
MGISILIYRGVVVPTSQHQVAREIEFVMVVEGARTVRYLPRERKSGAPADAQSGIEWE